MLEWTKEYFCHAELESARLRAEVLLSHVLGCQRIELYARYDYQPKPDELATYRQLVKRAADHEPVAYLVGHREFYSLKFKVTKDVLVPRAETEMLVDEAISHLKNLGRAGLMWDICTGSGCVAVSAASQVQDVTVLASDICTQAIGVAEENAQANGVSDRVRCRQSDLATIPEDCKDMGDFDVITANPPYVGVDDDVGPGVKHEPKLALYAGPDGLKCIRPLVVQAGQVLLSGGLFAMEFGCGQADAVRDLIVATGNFHEPRILVDHQGIERVSVAIKI